MVLEGGEQVLELVCLSVYPSSQGLVCLFVFGVLFHLSKIPAFIWFSFFRTNERLPIRGLSFLEVDQGFVVG